jgi:hypothetical protein
MCSPAPQAGDRGFKSRTARFAQPWTAWGGPLRAAAPPRHHAIVAEWLRRLPSKQLYAGSIPAGRSKLPAGNCKEPGGLAEMAIALVSKTMARPPGR